MTVALHDSFTVSVDGTVAKAKRHPTQQNLVDLAEQYRSTLQVIKINASYGNPSKPLNFSEVGCLPALHTLSLHCVNISCATFTEANTPALESLEFNNIEEVIHLHLDLPVLKSFTAEHTYSDGTPNALGDSLTRCPNLQFMHTYKFRFLEGRNFCVLPSMVSMGLWRAECLQSLEILSAPLLENLDVEEATSLDVLRLWDLPAATPADALSMNKKGMGRARVAKVMDDIHTRKVPKRVPKDDPPLCEVNTVGMDLSQCSFQHLMGNERVTIKDDDADDFMAQMEAKDISGYTDSIMSMAMSMAYMRG